MNIACFMLLQACKATHMIYNYFLVLSQSTTITLQDGNNSEN